MSPNPIQALAEELLSERCRSLIEAIEGVAEPFRTLEPYASMPLERQDAEIMRLFCWAPGVMRALRAIADEPGGDES